MKSLSETARFLRELIAIPSVNPAFLSEGNPCAGEGKVAEFLVERAKKAGLELQPQKVGPGRSNILVKLKPIGRARKRIFLAPHMDTVGGDLKFIFKPRLVGDRMYGRGACDTKGSLSAMFCALLELAESSGRPKETEITFAGLVDEENNQLGSRHLAKSKLKADFAIVGEPTCLKVVTAHKGNIWIKLSVKGKAAHGAKPHLGINAIYKMADVVEILRSEYAESLKKQRHPLLGQATINIGRIRGGTQPNIVPDECCIEIDRRTLPGEVGAEILSDVRQVLKIHGLECQIESVKGVNCPPMETAPEHPLVQQFLKAARKKDTEGVDYFCDAAVLGQAGIPSIVFGPGDISQAHTADEWISLKSLDRATNILLRFLKSLP